MFWLGGMALELSDENLTIAPPVWAGPVSVTNPRQDVPPETVNTEVVKLCTVGSGGFTTKVQLCDDPP